jgi:hypothetical protein
VMSGRVAHKAVVQASPLQMPFSLSKTPIYL